MPELYEVLLIDGGSRWHAGYVVDDETETDVLLAESGKVLLFGSRAGLEHHAQEHGMELSDELPDEIDLDLGGWLPAGSPEPSTAEVSELWHLLIDDPVAGKALGAEALEDVYDDLTDDEPDWFARHGNAARSALTASVAALRSTLHPA